MEDWQQLLNCPAWDRLVELGSAQVTGESQAILNTVTHNLEEMSEQNYAKGRLMGIHAMLQMPLLELQHAEESLDRLPEPEDEEDNG